MKSITRFAGPIIVVALLLGGAFYYVDSNQDDSADKVVVIDNQTDLLPAIPETASQATEPVVAAADDESISEAEVKAHNQLSDCWIIVESVVYDISAELRSGDLPAAVSCGDTAISTELGRLESVLAGYRIGDLR